MTCAYAARARARGRGAPGEGRRGVWLRAEAQGDACGPRRPCAAHLVPRELAAAVRVDDVEERLHGRELHLLLALAAPRLDGAGLGVVLAAEEGAIPRGDRRAQPVVEQLEDQVAAEPEREEVLVEHRERRHDVRVARAGDHAGEEALHARLVAQGGELEGGVRAAAIEHRLKAGRLLRHLWRSSPRVERRAGALARGRRRSGSGPHRAAAARARGERGRAPVRPRVACREQEHEAARRSPLPGIRPRHRGVSFFAGF